MAATNKSERSVFIIESFDTDVIYELKITIVDERYYGEDTCWGVYQFSGDAEKMPIGVIPALDPFDEADKTKTDKIGTLSGKMQRLQIGGQYDLKCRLKKDNRFGWQYEPISIMALIPQSKESQMIYLKSLISEDVANNLLKEYPNIVDDVVSGRVDEIDYTKVKGVQAFTWNRIKEKIFDNYIMSDIIVMLKPLGITFAMIKKLQSEEPNAALLKQQLLDNPYIMTKINGLGFKKIDDLAMKLKPELYCSFERLVAFTRYYFSELGDNEGHTWVSENIFKSAISNNIPQCMEYLERLFSSDSFLYCKDGKVGLRHYYNVENKIRRLLIEKSQQISNISFTNDQIEQAIKAAEDEQGFEYVPEQKNVIYKTLQNTVSFITGKAGTGKSSIMRAILKAYKMNNYTISACALSAMAAQRITEATGFPASTIHRLLGCQGEGKFMFNEDNPIWTDVVFLDEGSMVNSSLFLTLIKALSRNTRFIVSGDHKQLPPIGYGNTFSDLIEVFPKKYVNNLTKPMRQALESGILADANQIRENINPITENAQPKIIHGKTQDMYYMFRNNREQLFKIAVNTYMKSIETDGLDNVVIAVPRKKDCLNSTSELNKVIQDKLLPDETRFIKLNDIEFRVGAKVMQTVNDYEKNVFNGEIGYISDIYENGKTKCCEVIFADNKKIVYQLKELEQLDLAYAMTVHKLQGAGKKTVIGIIDNTHYKLLDNCMLYTLLTRAKKRCLLLAEPQAFLACIKTSHNKRNTWTQLGE